MFKGYRSPNQFIVTQWPLSTTIGDFWCLVVDFQISVIVLLNEYSFGDVSEFSFILMIKFIICYHYLGGHTP